jgi:hypothetical protein
VRRLAVLLASIFVVGSFLASLFMVLFPYENLASDELRKDDWLAVAAPAVLGLAVATLILVVKRKTAWAAMSAAAQALIALLGLRFALRELSDGSDTQLVVLVLSIAVAGIGAVTASFAEQADTYVVLDRASVWNVVWPLSPEATSNGSSPRAGRTSRAAVLAGIAPPSHIPRPGQMSPSPRSRRSAPRAPTLDSARPGFGVRRPSG